VSSEVKVYTVITGASEGLGKALALECARHHYNLILTALPGKELENLSAFIKSGFDVDVISMGYDLTVEENCFKLCKTITDSGVHVNMLINNVGLGSTVKFENGDLDLFLKQIHLNIRTTVILSKLLLPLLINHRKSYILNVSSFSVFFFLYAKTVYGATKAFIYYFSKSLRKELKSKGVNVTVLLPGGMNTNIEKYITNKATGFFPQLSFMNPEDVAPVAIKALLEGKEEIIPGYTNKFFRFLDYILPGPLKKMLTLYNFKKIEK
jgi:short-subunit dehydrogenase